ncbi:hypothetical protein PENTCL1PPCAC_1283 [Pristionchus entomophagus]|uniref:UPAR/Ly6 domain-containing protein n=1 Tax=Pristionchus entomophagus TaxID=358040 RepID=A0AAV5SEN4_9BILA|nr:hypothetical protein PENTCL1PPCAC_1283 [Pristionchus entomophagus]
MMRPLLALLLLHTVAAFECWSCGVFLSAPCADCKGQPKNVTCPNAELGCVSITAENPDGTYYVEKNCVQPEDAEFKQEGCRAFGIRGAVGTACVCKTELCNGGMSTISISTLISGSLLLILRGR